MSSQFRLNWLVTSTTLDAIQGQDTSVRDATSKGRVVQGTRRPRDGTSADFLFGDTSVRDTLSHHQHTPLSLCIRTRKKPLMLYTFSTEVRLTSVINHDELKLWSCSLRWCKSTSERSYSGWVDFFPADHADRVSEKKIRETQIRLTMIGRLFQWITRTGK